MSCPQPPLLSGMESSTRSRRCTLVGPTDPEYHSLRRGHFTPEVRAILRNENRLELASGVANAEFGFPDHLVNNEIHVIVVSTRCHARATKLLGTIPLDPYVGASLWLIRFQVISASWLLFSVASNVLDILFGIFQETVPFMDEQGDLSGAQLRDRGFQLSVKILRCACNFFQSLVTFVEMWSANEQS
ncbi:hypothetical protein PHYPSEUDO_008508 [Phytophthora pseudosyringae]|uniref:Uncharacterized protein n=1 Tax=Phytophthora pseudosyringae TaxID=221518 RepID=A0A8T1VH78_9STRA|nr:hypothetical protein PHYPSEUDO_008508 [Phytophthora pseudosyringae]